jgi:TPR repeat protein
MYENGIGVTQSYSKAYVWFSVSVAQGYILGIADRDEIAVKLTPEDLSTAQAIASRCFESKFKDCE